MNTSKTGFTLVEIMIAMTIIALLSVVVYASVVSARDKARDASLINEIGGMFLLIQKNISSTGTFPTSATLPLSINGEPVQQTSPNGRSYQWEDNTSHPLKFCVWEELDDSDYPYYVINESSRGYSDTAPTSVTDCDITVAS